MPIYFYTPADTHGAFSNFSRHGIQAEGAWWPTVEHFFQAQKFGDEQVKIWRRSYDIPPPNGESLKDTAARTLPYFQSTIVPLLKQGKNVIVAAHGNSLRSIVMDLEKLTKEQVLELNLATGVPLVYGFDAQMNRVSKKELK